MLLLRFCPAVIIIAVLGFLGLFECGSARAAALSLTNPVVFVTQVPIPREINGNVSNTFLSVVSLFGNHLADTARAGRGGDLWLMTTNGGLVNLTRGAGFGTNGSQDGVGIAARDPAIHWGGSKALFSMVVGAPTNASDTTTFAWQLYEVTNLGAVIANTNTKPVIALVSNQPAGFNNVSPAYGTDGRIIFMTDRPHNGAMHLYPTREEYKGHPTVTGTWSLDSATGNLRLLNHTPSGAFNPIVDSFGRIIETRWDHLVQDSNAVDDRLGRATNGSVNFTAEAAGAGTSPNTVETFPEPRNFDTNALAVAGVRGMSFNFFFPWMLPESGGAEELLNHVGRHEISQSVLGTFTNDANLINFTNPATRPLQGIRSSNTNFFLNFFQIAEDPRNPGTYFGVDAPDFSPVGGSHTAGQIMTLTGPPNMNPTNMVISYVTAKSTFNPNALGIFRNPLPMSDGTLIAAFTSTPGSQLDTNVGTAAFPDAIYKFKLAILATNVSSGGFFTTNRFLTSGLTNVVSYWDGSTRVTHTNALWELQPVEVRSRVVPAPWQPGIDPIEQQVFDEEGVDLPTFQADLAKRGVALVVSRNVTSRDAADKQQPYNLRVPGGAQTIGTNSGRIYDITHLQYLQADYLRGYSNNAPVIQPGRRALAVPMHDTSTLNRPSSKPNAPAGGAELFPDGSQAALLPANRALTWHLTGTTNESLVKERYWVTFRPGEVRTCANCHGINDRDQAGQTAPTNPAQALRDLLRHWKTNAANAYTLSITNGTGGGSFGAGSIVALTASATPSGKAFSHWIGAGISNNASPTTLVTMPAADAAVVAVFTNLPSPAITTWQMSGTPGFLTLNAQASANRLWAVQSSTNLVNWVSFSTSSASPAGLLQLQLPFDTNQARMFYRLQSP